MDMGCGNSGRDGSTEAVRAPRRYPDSCEYAAGSGALPGSDTLTGRPRDRACPGSPERGGFVPRRLSRARKGPGTGRPGRAGARRGHRSPGRGRGRPAVLESRGEVRGGQAATGQRRSRGVPAGRAAAGGILPSVGVSPAATGTAFPLRPRPLGTLLGPVQAFRGAINHVRKVGAGYGISPVFFCLLICAPMVRTPSKPRLCHGTSITSAVSHAKPEVYSPQITVPI